MKSTVRPEDRPSCLWCGTPLTENTVVDWDAAQRDADPYSRATRMRHTTGTGRFGYEGTGLFCTLRHGFNYGVREASRERARLQALTNRIDADMDRYGADLTRAARDVEEARSDDGRG